MHKQVLENSVKKASLVHQYIYYAATIIALTASMCVYVTLSENRAHEEEHNIKIQNDLLRLSVHFEEKVSVAEHITRMLVAKIVESNDFSDKNLSFLIKHQRDNASSDAFAWTMLHYVNPEYYMTANSMEGVMKNKILMDGSKRVWMKTARDNPFTLQFSPPDIGVITNEPILSTGYAFTNLTGEFEGYISAALDIIKLEGMLKLYIDKDTNFILLDKDMNITIMSDQKIDYKTISRFPIDIKFNNIYDEPIKLKKDIQLHGYSYSHALALSQYPFIFLIGHKSALHNTYISQQILPQILRNMVLGIMFAATLLLVGYKALSPILELSKVANNIAKGKKVKIPMYNVDELDSLSMQLAHIYEYNKDLRDKQLMLSKANDNLDHANDFIKNNMSFLTHELKNPASIILNFSKSMQTGKGNINDEYNKECIDLIYSAASHQNKQIDFFLALSKFQEQGKNIELSHIDLKQIIFSNINMVRHHATKNNVTIEIDIEDNLPNMLGDEIIIGQMIQNFAANGSKYNKPGGKLYIKIFTRTNAKDKKELIMQFKDTGVGLSEQELQHMRQRFEQIKSEKIHTKFAYGVGLSFSESYIIAHDGELQVRSMEDVGTVFNIIFPHYRLA